MLAETVIGRTARFGVDHEALRVSVRQFLEREVSGRLGEWADGSIPAEAWTVAGDSGFLGFGIADEFGGAGVTDPRFTAVVVEEAMRIGATSVAVAVTRLGAVSSVLSAAQSSIAEKWLPVLASGAERVAVLGLDVAIPAVRSAEGIRLDGVSPAVLGGADAALLIVVANVADEEPSLVLVDGGSAGVERFDSPGLLGVGAAGVAAVSFAAAEGVVLTSGESLVDRFRSEEAFGLSLAATAGAAAALEIAVDYVRARKVFGRPLSEFENTRFALADIAVRIGSVQAMLDACMLERDVAVLTGPRAAALALAATEAHIAAVDAALQLHGGYGYMREYPIAQAFADARYLRLLATSNGAPHHLIADALGL